MVTTKTDKKARPKPFLFPQFCKACGRCIEACPKDCIHVGTQIDPNSGLTPVVVELDKCNGCGLCIDACPEPYGLMPVEGEIEDMSLMDPAQMFGPRQTSAPKPEPIPGTLVPLPDLEPMVWKGTNGTASLICI